MGSYQVLSLRTRVDLGAMAMNVTPHFPKLKHHWNLTIRLFSVISGHSLEKSYPSAEMQSVYSTALAEWAKVDCGFIE